MVLVEYVKEIYIRLFFVLCSILLMFLSFFSYREEYFYKLGGVVWDLVDGSFIFTGFGEAFLGYVWMSFVFAFLVGAWLFVLNFYLFLLPGLYRIEALFWCRRLLSSFLLYSISLLLLHKFFLSIICWYLIGYGVSRGVGGLSLAFEPRFGEFIFFMIGMDIVFGLLLLIIGGVTLFLDLKKKALGRIRYGCYCFLLIIILALVPPDFFLHLIFFFLWALVMESIFLFIYCKAAYDRYLEVKMLSESF